MSLSMRRNIGSIIAVAVFGMLSYMIGFEAQSRAQVDSQRVDGTMRPFLAKRRTDHYSPKDGSFIKSTYDTYWRRSDGSRIHIFDVTSPDGDEGQVVEFDDLKARRTVVLEPFTKSAQVYPISETKATRKRKHQTQCLSGYGEVEDGGDILGVETVHIQDGRKGFDVDLYLAPSLGCLPLRDSATHPSGARNESEITQLNFIEPPESLFSIPDGYVSRSPVEVERKYRQKFPGHVLYGDTELARRQTRYTAK